MEDYNKYFTVGVLTCINLLNYMDRFTIAGRWGHLMFVFCSSIIKSGTVYFVSV